MKGEREREKEMNEFLESKKETRSSSLFRSETKKKNSLLSFVRFFSLSLSLSLFSFSPREKVI